MSGFLIWSNHHKAWWGPNGSGYRSSAIYAGRYQQDETSRWLTRGCYCCRVPEVLVPAPGPDVTADPEAFLKYEKYAPRTATRAAIRAGQVNRYYDPEAAR